MHAITLRPDEYICASLPNVTFDLKQSVRSLTNENQFKNRTQTGSLVLTTERVFFVT